MKRADDGRHRLAYLCGAPFGGRQLQVARDNPRTEANGGAEARRISCEYCLWPCKPDQENRRLAAETRERRLRRKRGRPTAFGDTCSRANLPGASFEVRDLFGRAGSV